MEFDSKEPQTPFMNYTTKFLIPCKYFIYFVKKLLGLMSFVFRQWKKTLNINIFHIKISNIIIASVAISLKVKRTKI